MTALSPIQPAVGGAEPLQKLADEVARVLPILLRAEDCGLWPELTAGTGIATINGLVSALGNARAALASTSPAQTGEPVADVVLLSGKVASCRERKGHGLPDGPHALFATGGVDQAWVDKAEALAEHLETEAILYGESEPDSENERECLYRMVAARIPFCAHLSTALGAKGKS